MDDRLTQIEQLRRYVEYDMLEPDLDTLHDEVATLEAQLADLRAKADALADAVAHEREMVCQDMGMQLAASEAVDNALTAYRQATQEQTDANPDT